MFAKLLKSRAAVRAPTSPSIPEGTTVWAIGDVHGCADLLQALVEAVRAEARLEPARRKVVIFLGDYIDRGPDSRGVIGFLAGLRSENDGIEWRFLKGNHEEAMLDFLEDPAEGAKWCEYGGDATLVSYGLRVPHMTHRSEAWAHLAADLDHRLTAVERAFLEDLELSVTIGDYFFAHAGARPGRTLEAQSAADLLWIRRSFLDSPEPFEKVVVHGHTPTAEVYSDHRRIGIDTKAYESGILTALRLSSRDRAVIKAMCASDVAKGQEDGRTVRISVENIAGNAG